jgi:sulfhydrogenase subunit gamma (sulfur reductase)
MIETLPREAEVVERIEEAPGTFTLGLRFTDAEYNAHYAFAPGQFNMLYLHGVGEVPISVVSDPEDTHVLHHTIRRVGRVTEGMARLQVGDRIGVRGPYGRGWPIEQARGRPVLVATGGLGCAPVVSVINYVLKRRADYGPLTILQGVKHSNDLIWRDQYAAWSELPDVAVRLAADVADRQWHGIEGPVTELFDRIVVDPGAAAFVCGPEPMMIASARALVERGIPAPAISVSLERNMQCATGHCGHCQVGAQFVCGDGPVFDWPTAEPLLAVRNL